jgi:uncharacterized protein (TIGR03086 family)
MTTELLDQYGRASEWAAGKIAAASDLDAQSTCSGWDLRTLLNHMLETQRYFVSTARGQDASPPGPNPPSVLSAEPAADFRQVRQEVLDAYGEEGVIEKTGPSLGIAFADQLLHGWDVARTTGQDETMPEGLAQAAYDHIHGRFSDEQRKGVFGPEVQVGDDATPQQRLLAYTGRDPR